jgi:hypothetical protein
MTSTIQGFDELRTSAGALLGPLGFGFQSDWEVLERRVVTATQDEAFFWADGIYDEIEIVIMDWSSTTDNIEGEITLSTDGSTFHTGATDYDTARWSVTDTPTSGHSDQGGAHIPILTMGNLAAEHVYATLRIGNVSGSGSNKPILYDLMGKLASGSTTRDIHTAMLVVNTNSIRGINIGMASTNTYDAIIIVRGRRITPVSLISQDDWVVIDDQAGLSAVSTHDVFWDDQVYDEIEVSVSGMVIGTDNQTVELLMSTDGSTFLTGAGDYRWAWHSVNSDTGGVEGSDASNSDTVIDAFPALGTATDEHVDGTIHFTNVSNTTRKKLARFELAGILQGAFLFSLRGAAILQDNNNSLRGFRLDGQGATTFSADRIRVRGRRLTPIGVLKQDWEVLKTWDHADTGDTAEIEFVDIPSPEFDELELVLKDMNTGTTPNTLVLQFSDDNGVTWATGAVYQYAHTNRSPDVAYAETVDTVGTYIALTANFGAGNEKVSSSHILFAPLDGPGDRSVRFKSQAVNDSDNLRSQDGAGRWEGHTGTTTAFRLDLSAGGNFTGGRAVLRGRRKL